MLERNFRPGKINSWQSLMTLSFVLDKLSISSSDRARQVCTCAIRLLLSLWTFHVTHLTVFITDLTLFRCAMRSALACLNYWWITVRQHQI
jgi:hypothetical protein